jgi:hypothetical protein
MKVICLILAVCSISIVSHASCDGALEQLGRYADEAAYECKAGYGAGDTRGPDTQGCKDATKHYNVQQGTVNAQCALGAAE